tara:strand:- start:32 stop:139 length:108 start_codon:yes stop_codon:yes gene_type:complete
MLEKVEYVCCVEYFDFMALRKKLGYKEMVPGARME